MFSGLIQDTATIRHIEIKGQGLIWSINVDINKPLYQKNIIELGESIAIDGACHTVESINNNIIIFYSSKETLEKTIISSYKIGQIINIERSLRIGDSLGGHNVSGHIDGITNIANMIFQDSDLILQINIPIEYRQYILAKGSISINGISLTISQYCIDTGIIDIYIIPHTRVHTNIQYLQTNSPVNFEIDQIAKYIYQYVQGLKQS